MLRNNVISCFLISKLFSKKLHTYHSYNSNESKSNLFPKGLMDNLPGLPDAGSIAAQIPLTPKLIIDELEQISEFDRNQINRLYHHFTHLSGTKGYMTRQDFAVNFHLMGTMDAQICAKYFDLFDRSNNGSINFEDFVLGLGQLCKMINNDRALPNYIVKEEGDARLIWTEDHPKVVFLIKKWQDARVTEKAREVCRFMQSKGLEVLVEKDSGIVEGKASDPFKDMKLVDFVVVIGGDGTLLHLSSLVEEARLIPPVLPFAMGSLGFLTPFEIAHYVEYIERVLNSKGKTTLYCTLRTRLKCEVWVNGRLDRVRRVLNECLIDRGASPFLSKLNCSIDGHQVTTVQADGLIIATPSGSTAYNTAAGGAMVVPSVSCTLLTPVAPHSLSFRPIIVPDSSIIDINVPENARASARASFDGRHEVDLPRGSRVRIETSKRPFPIISTNSRETDWYTSIKSKLSWNVRIEQGEMPD